MLSPSLAKIANHTIEILSYNTEILIKKKKAKYLANKYLLQNNNYFAVNLFTL